jgi:hypothetical protein
MISSNNPKHVWISRTVCPKVSSHRDAMTNAMRSNASLGNVFNAPIDAADFIFSKATFKHVTA